MLGKVITVGVILIAHGIRTTWQFCPGHCECINSELKVNCSVASGPDWQDSIVSSYVPLPPEHHQQHHGSRHGGGGGGTPSSTYLNEIPILLNPQIQILILHGNKIGDLTPYSLQYYTRLLELDLSGNRVGGLGDGSFQTLTSLQLLNVSANRIQSVGAGAFRGLGSLLRLDLSANDIHAIQSTRTFKPLTQLERLHLDKNRISHLDLTLFAHQSRLTTLTLSHNHIQSVSPPQQPILPGLVLDSKQQDDGGGGGGNPGGLLELVLLNLSFNRLDRVGEGVFDGMAHLQVLDLSHNMLQGVEPDAFGNTLHLRQINLSHNSIDSLPPQTLSRCVELFAVDLSHNNLRAIPSHYFHNLFKLESVDVSHNPVELFEPMALADSVNLVEFKANHLLQLGHIPLQLLTNKPVLKLFSLQYANIQKLPLTVLPESSSPRLLQQHHQQQQFPSSTSFANGLPTEQQRTNSDSSAPRTTTNGLDFYDEPSTALLPPTALPLHTLDLTGNPWECNCSAYALHTYIINYAGGAALASSSEDDPGHYFRNIVCATPAQVASLPLIQLPTDTFASCVQQSDSFMETVLILGASLVALVILIVLVKVLLTCGACARIRKRKQASSSPIVQVPPTFHRASAGGGGGHQHRSTPAASYSTTRTTSTNGVDYIHHPHLPYAMGTIASAHYLNGHPSQFGNLMENYPPPPPPFLHSTLGPNNKFLLPTHFHDPHHQNHQQPPTQPADHQHIIFPTTLRGPRLDFNNQHYYHTVKHAAFHNNRYEKQVPSVLV